MNRKSNGQYLRRFYDQDVEAHINIRDAFCLEIWSWFHTRPEQGLGNVGHHRVSVHECSYAWMARMGFWGLSKTGRQEECNALWELFLSWMTLRCGRSLLHGCWTSTVHHVLSSPLGEQGLWVMWPPRSHFRHMECRAYGTPRCPSTLMRCFAAKKNCLTLPSHILAV